MYYSIWQITSAVLYITNMGLAVFIAITMILRKQDPVKTLSWVMVLILLPYIGIFLYLFFGQYSIKKRIYEKKGDADSRARKAICGRQMDYLNSHPDELTSTSSEFVKVIKQNLKVGFNPVEFNKEINFYFIGRDSLDAMYDAISNASKYIHLQSYIIEDDRVGNRFKDLLIEKAKNGVEVRLIIDGLGSYSLKRKFLKELRLGGVEVLVFSPVRFLLPTFSLNYRNHRKILVVDGEYGFIGGVNIADRYYYGTETGDWHDTHMRVSGDAVVSMQRCFLQDRYFILNKYLMRKKYFPPEMVVERERSAGNHIVSQTIISGPDNALARIMLCYLSVISSATDHIYIATPYFTPSETILNAIKTAALGGVDVRIILPEVSDSKITHWSTMSYVQELLNAGVKIYLFGKGFNHSKVISVDGKVAIVGSANMDMRSFEHNFEIMSLIYDAKSASVIEQEFIRDVETCKFITKAKWEKRPMMGKIQESFARLWSPLL